MDLTSGAGLAVGVYLAAILAVGYAPRRRREGASLAEFYLAGRQLGGPVLYALSLLVIVALVSAIMSTADSVLLSLSSILAKDVWGTTVPGRAPWYDSCLLPSWNNALHTARNRRYAATTDPTTAPP